LPAAASSFCPRNAHQTDAAMTPEESRPSDESRHPDTEETPVPGKKKQRKDAPDSEEEPAPGVRHLKEPNAENIIPAKHRPGTL
jgi:hypothetical protein